MKETHITLPRLPDSPKLHRPPAPRPLYRKTNVNLPVHLIHLSPNPGHLARKVYLVSKHLSRLGARPERIQSCVDDGGRRFLVVEDAERGDSNNGQEDRKRAPGSPGGNNRWEFSVRTPAHEGLGAGSGGCDELSAGSTMTTEYGTEWSR